MNRLEKARAAWRYNGSERPPFAVEPKKGQRSVWDFPRPPRIEKVAKTVTVLHKKETLVQTQDALAVLETASPPTYYIPEKDIAMDLLMTVPGRTSVCEWKGSATYWTLKSKTDQFVAWSYLNPFLEFEALQYHLAFYPHHLDCRVDGNRVEPQPGAFYAGWITPDLVGPFKGEPGTGHW